MSEYTYKPIFYTNGSIYSEQWFKDGKKHREGDKPAFILYDKEGSIYEELWYKDGIEYIPQTDSCHDKVVEIDGKKYKLTLVD